MKKKIVVLTDEQFKELSKYPNQSDIIRQALDVYMTSISPEMLNGMRMTYKKIQQQLAGIENAVAKIAEAGSVTIDKHSEWGAWYNFLRKEKQMAKRQPKTEQSKGSDVNGEGNEKDDNTSSSVSDLQGYSVKDFNPKIAGLANGYAQKTRTK